jgi:hypothetical protein
MTRDRRHDNIRVRRGATVNGLDDIAHDESRGSGGGIRRNGNDACPSIGLLQTHAKIPAARKDIVYRLGKCGLAEIPKNKACQEEPAR